MSNRDHFPPITLPWPSAKLSGHAKGSWREKHNATKKSRENARLKTLVWRGIHIPDGDIKLRVTFYPPDRRGDRANYPNRIKPYLDGVADAMGVNDKRFDIPEYSCTEPVGKRAARVTIEFLKDG